MVAMKPSTPVIVNRETHNQTGDPALGSTAGEVLCRWIFMVSAFFLVGGANPITCGSAPLARCNPRLLRRAGINFSFIASHTVQAAAHARTS
jgi:hypothetical protein